MHEKMVALYCKAVNFLKREDGASAIEYGIIAGLIAVVIIAGAENIGDNLNSMFEFIATKIPTGATGG